MNWTFATAPKRAGAPALGILIVKSGFEIARKEPGASSRDIIQSNTLLMGTIWIVVAIVLFVVMRFVSRRSAAR
jgi:heme/copper-type cytochrome/quinol oxidase subunit 2